MGRLSWLVLTRRRFLTRLVPGTARRLRRQPRLEQLEDRVVPAMITGQAFTDLNASGIKQTGAPGLSGWTIYLDANNNGMLDAGETSTTTDSNGNYSFPNLDAGTYTVREVVPPTWFQSLPRGPDVKYTVTLASDQTVDSRDFGNYQLGEIHGTAFEDTNATGTKDSSKPGLPSWTVYWDQNNNGLLDQNLNSFTSADVPKNIPDLTTVTSALPVSGLSGQTIKVNATVNIAQTWDDDLNVFLISPAGTRVELFSHVGSNGQNFTFTTLDDQVPTPITAGTAPFTGNYRPKGSLATVNGQNPNGTWTLEVTNTVAGDTGTLLGWSLTLITSEPSVQTDVNGAYAFTGLTPGTYSIREVLPPAWVQSKPAGTSLGYTVTVTSGQSVTGQDFGTYRPVEIDGTVFEDLNGNGVKDVGEPGTPGWMVYLDQNNNGVLDQSTTTVSSADAPKDIPDQSTIRSALPVKKVVGRLSHVSVTLSITHTRDSDLSASLLSPAGTRVQLFTHVNDSGQNFTNTTLDDQAPTAITAGTAPFTGSFSPQGALATLNGQDPNGTWTLEVTDDVAGETGTLQSWSLALSVPTEPIAVSSANGSFAFKGLKPGPYTVREIAQPNWMQTEPAGPSFQYTATLTSGQVAAGRDFGNQRVNALPTTIEGVNYDGDAANNTHLDAPPDPNGAVGPNHLVSVVNDTIQWFTKAGTLQNNQSLVAFFAPLNPVDSPQNPYDPRVDYDPYAGRFVVTALEQTDTVDGFSANSSRILVAVSSDNNPNDPWFYQAINSNLTINGLARWVDFDALAVDADAIYVTGNMVGFGSTGTYAGTRLWILNKTALYAGGTAPVTVQDPEALARVVTGSSEVSFLAPAQVFGPKPGGVGTFFITAGWATNNGDDYLSILRLDNSTTNPVFTNQFLNLGHIYAKDMAFFLAPQRGSSTGIRYGPPLSLNAVWRSNTLWVADVIVPPSGPDVGQPTVHWYRIDTTNLAALALKDQGNVGGEDIAPGTYTFDPALTVNSAGTMGLGFSASGPSIFPGAYYTGRLSTDPPGTVRTSRTLAAGQDYYVRTFGSGQNRWGDFSSIAVDPADDTTFWVYNEYAMPRGSADSSGQAGRWATRFGRFTITGDPGQAPPQPPDPGDELTNDPVASDLSVAATVRVLRDLVGPEWVLALNALSGSGSRGSGVGSQGSGLGVLGTPYSVLRTNPQPLTADFRLQDGGNFPQPDAKAVSALLPPAVIDQAFLDFTRAGMEDTRLGELLLG